MTLAVAHTLPHEEMDDADFRVDELDNLTTEKLQSLYAEASAR